ncbi:MAG: hypothetical protein E6R03_02330 [Hyphomicrobiaceae bacterium]|nr:MAG: hypothetical protein E6R03_02330 [Hyphomicrobiaceae bacterium]
MSPLPRIQYTIPLGVGIDTKTDPKVLRPGRLVELENGLFKNLGSVELWPGVSRLGQSVANAQGASGTSGATSVSGAVHLTTDYGGELVVASQNCFYSYSKTRNAWIERGKLLGCGVEAFPVIRNNYEQTCISSFYSNGFAIFAWEDSSGGVKASVFDLATRKPVLADALIASGGSRPKCIGSGNSLFVYYMITAGNKLCCRQFTLTDPSAFSSEVTLASNAHGSSPHYDIAPHGKNFVLAYRTSTPQIRLGFIRVSDGNFAGATDGFPTPVTNINDPSNAIAVLSNFESDINNQAIYVCYQDGTSLRNIRFELDLTEVGEVTVEGISTTIRNIGLVMDEASLLRAFYEVDSAQTYNRKIRTNTVTTSGTVGTASDLIRSSGLHSKPFRYNGTTYVVAAFESILQSTYFLLTASGSIVNRFSYSRGGGNTQKVNSLVPVSAIDDTQFLVGSLFKGPLRSESGSLFTVRGGQGVILNFDPKKLFFAAKLGPSLFVSSGLVHHYDGQSLNEAGFHLYPENCSASVDNGSGNLVAGDRQFCVVYEWTDQNGQLHRSAPSIPVSFTTTGGTSKVTYTIPTLRITGKTNVSLAVYRTKAAETTFYRVSSITSPTFSSKSSDSVDFIDNTADSSIGGNELLYTTGGVFENIEVPSAGHITTYRDRLIVSQLEDRLEWGYSKRSAQNIGIGVPEEFRKRIDKGEGGILATVEYQDKLLLFKETNVYVTAGDGLADTGIGTEYPDSEPLQTDVGCSEPKSILLTPVGVIFKSIKGFYLINQTLDPQYLGAPAEAFNALRVSGAALDDSRHMAVWTHYDGPAIFYDYLTNQWGTRKNFEATSLSLWSGLYTLGRSDGGVDIETPENYFDNGASLRLRLKTPWINLSGIQGFKRVYRAMFLGEYFSPFLAVVRIYYNYEKHFREQHQIDSDVFIGRSYFGQDSYFGRSLYIGGLNRTVPQFEVRPAIQKCEAIQFEIEIQNPTAVDGKTCSLTAMDLEVGIKKDSRGGALLGAEETAL